MGYPNRLKSARIPPLEGQNFGPSRVGEVEVASVDALGIPIDEDFGAKVVVLVADKNVANGVPGLDSGGKILAANLPTLTPTHKGCFAFKPYAEGEQQLNNGTNLLTFGDETWDTDGYHSAAAKDRLVIPAGLGGYYHLRSSGSCYNGVDRLARLTRNGGAGGVSGWTVVKGYSSSGHWNVNWLCYLNAGDYVTVEIWTNHYQQGVDFVNYGEFNCGVSAALLRF